MPDRDSPTDATPETGLDRREFVSGLTGLRVAYAFPPGATPSHPMTAGERRSRSPR